MELNPRQFTAYRGLLVDTGRAPEDDEEIVARLRPHTSDSTLYGKHWSTDQGIAQRFATDPTAGGYETPPAWTRRFRGGVDKWGVVLEAQVQGRGQDFSEPYSGHEREVRVHRPDLDHPAANHPQSIRAHVFDMPSRKTIAEQHPLDPERPGAGRRRSEVFKEALRTPVRSFSVPEEHWRR